MFKSLGEKIWFYVFNSIMALFLFYFYLLWLEPVYRGFMASLPVLGEACIGVMLSLILAIFSVLVFDFVLLKVIKLIDGLDEKEDTDAYFKD